MIKSKKILNLNLTNFNNIIKINTKRNIFSIIAIISLITILLSENIGSNKYLTKAIGRNNKRSK